MSDAVIEVFGTVNSIKGLKALALAASIEGKLDWTQGFSEEEAIELFVDAVDEERPFRLTRNDTRSFFDMVTRTCKEEGLSYVVSIGEEGAEGYTNGFSWRPGMTEEAHFELDGIYPVVRLTELKATMSQGIEAVERLVQKTEELAATGAFAFHPDVAASLGADGGYSAPLVNSCP